MIYGRCASMETSNSVFLLEGSSKLVSGDCSSHCITAATREVLLIFLKALKPMPKGLLLSIKCLPMPKILVYSQTCVIQFLPLLRTLVRFKCLTMSAIIRC